MWEIWANYMLPKALKTCPKSNIAPNLVTLIAGRGRLEAYCEQALKHQSIYHQSELGTKQI